EIRRVQVRRAVVIENQSKQLVILLRKAIDARSQVVTVLDPGHRYLATLVLGRALFRCGTRQIQDTALVVRSVEVIEGRNREHQSWAKRTYPGKRHEGIGLTIHIVKECTLGVWIVGIEGHLVEIASDLRDQPQLVLRVC